MELKKYKLADIGKVITGKTPSTSIAENYAWGTIPFYTPEDVAKGLGMMGRNSRFISKTGFEEIASNTISGESVLVGCIGSDMGNVAYSNITCATNQQINAITQFKNGIDPLYVYYLLSTMKSYFQKIAGSTTTPILPKSIFEEIEIHLPDMKKQKDVVSILYALDRKIELNKQINDNLEAMAKQLYDYWFVQFDFPNEEGKPYKSSGGAMVYNERLKREIPVGWQVENLVDFAEIKNGATPSTSDDTNYGGDIVWITPKDLSDQQSKFVYQGERNITKQGLDSCSTSMLPINSVLMSSRAPIGLISIAKHEVCTNQGFKSFIPKNMEDSIYLYYYIKHHIKQIEQLGTGTTFKEVSRDDLCKFPILVVGANETYKQWVELQDEIANKQFVLTKEIASLTKQRDELLPLLMNGQASVNYHLCVFQSFCILYRKQKRRME